MKRRDLVVGLSAVGILAGAVPGRAQRTRRVGYLSPEPPGAAAGQTEAALRQGLRDLGWIDGQNLTIIIRQAETPERMAAAAAELARLDVDLIVSAGSVATAAAKAATSRIPIVFGSAPDPVRRGFVESLARPGGNLTGLAILDEIVPKLLEIVREIVPQARRAAYLFEPAITPEPLRSQLTTERESAARLLGMDYQELPIRAADDIPGAITRAAFDGVDNLLLETSGLLLTQRHVVAALAAEQRIPAVGRDRNLCPPELSCPMASRFRTSTGGPPSTSTRCSREQSPAICRSSSRSGSSWCSTSGRRADWALRSRRRSSPAPTR
jgi:putative tryptophan/tyrosine transport system substrate-binding protein